MLVCLKYSKIGVIKRVKIKVTITREEVIKPTVDSEIPKEYKYIDQTVLMQASPKDMRSLIRISFLLLDKAE